MSNEIQGVVKSMSAKDRNTKYGVKPAYSFNINDEWYSAGFKTWGVREGDEVVIQFDQTPQGYRNITSVTKVGTGSTPKSTDSGSKYVPDTFPMEPLAPKRSINRQNALTNAVAFCTKFFSEPMEIPWTQESFKNIWKLVQNKMFDISSTTAIHSDKVAKVYDAMNRGISERTGVYIPFPSKDMLDGN